MLATVFIVLLLVALTALYVAAEFATVAVRSIRIQAMAEAGNSTAKKLLPYLKDAASLDRYVAACQIGITLSSLVLGAFGQARLAEYLRPVLGRVGGLDEATAASAAATLILILLTTFHVVLGELLPKAIALRFPETVSLALTYPMLFSLKIFSVAIGFLNGSGTALLRMVGVPISGHRHVHSPEELEQLIQHGSSSLKRDDAKLLTRVFRFGDHNAQDLMVARNRLVAVDLKESVEKNLQRMQSSGHTRFPVFDGDADKVMGFVHLKDVARALQAGSLGDFTGILRPALMLPGSVAADELFRRMREERAHLAVVLDEFGGTQGIVTMENVLEEIVGEIRDEFEQTSARVLERDDRGGLTVRGDLLLEQLAEELSLELDLDGVPVSTVGGLILHLLGRAATLGEQVIFAGLRLTVRDLKRRRIAVVQVESLPDV